MEIFGKVQFVGTKQWKDMTFQSFIIKDPNSDRGLLLEASQNKLAALQSDGFADGSIGTMRIFTTVRESNGRYFNSISPTSWRAMPQTAEVKTDADPFAM